ncbi:MAG: response regulator [Pontiellaceae bacterium]|nr:response regulator [Pontiellaceae bacterium]MBN2784729.1 response regulator [Pontiellaceae bacterium]
MLNQSRKVLVVEDDVALQELLLFNLEKDGWDVTVADSGETALLKVVDLLPDVIVLDLMLPGVDGRQVCQQVRRYPKTRSIPIIMISALGQDDDVVGGLEMGADDYIAKPFSPEVLLARIEAVMRRCSVRPEEESSGPISIHNLDIDPLRFSVKVDGKSVTLTHTDFLILQLLASEPGRVYTRRQIIDAAHDRDVSISERSVDVQIVGLRRKIGSAGRVIETVRGVGYRLKEL